VYSVYRADIQIIIFIAVGLGGFKRRFDLGLIDECIWIGIPILDGLNLLTGNHYFLPDSDSKTTEQHFYSLEDNLNPRSFLVILGDFKVPGNDRDNGFLQANPHYCTKIRGDIIRNAACYFGCHLFSNRRMW
jgi:hypothetical protein